ncbi:hypothetical protein [Lacimicrobium alkaliphilum]|uniref:Uncharacterized protein n=1 Tax=Lacimicrobium alkaliphilum TaxID=1526571 RepID=A0A0U3ALA2_9ALTE|nr:hypothetical protein [Lacimicrobium alkaliphilum]ALS99537.1 hypothetical protein AT746_15575 [Lacimicrobium alkaliphilum]
MHLLLITLTLLLLSGCAEQPEQSESQLRLASVHQQAQKHLNQARELISSEVIRHPAQHLETIFEGHRLVIEARQVYRKADVFGLEPQALSDFEQQLAEFNPILAEHAVSLMQELKERTLILREKVQKIRDAESGVGKVSGAQSIKRLSRLYNDEVDKCCLRDIYSVIEILHHQQPETYSGVVQLGMRATDEMVKILQNKNHAAIFQRKIDALKPSI